MMKELQYTKGIGPKRAETLERELEIRTGLDVLEHYPFRYEDRSHVMKIRDLTANMSSVQIMGRFLTRNIVGEGTKRRMQCRFADDTGAIDIVWFKGIGLVQDKINNHDVYLLFGKPTAFGSGLNMAHPEMEVNPDMDKLGGTMVPFYETTEAMKRVGLNSKGFRNIVETIFADLTLGGIPETLPASLIAQKHLMSRAEALYTLHFPTPGAEGHQRLTNAQFRLKFEELFYVELSLLRNKNKNHKEIAGRVIGSGGPHLNELYANHMRFEPTGAQKRVVHEIFADLRSGRQMNRLVQGDVGSGKTLVALMAMLIATGNGLQACMMAPTEILAQQHYENLREQLNGMDVRVELLTGGVKGKARRQILKDLADGKIAIIVGTHALLEPTVVFKNLALSVIDEQHRFGVEQRSKLWAKSTPPPHVLVMTATPIPRTLAMTMYGDLDVSVIDEMPPGRKPVTTEHYFHNSRNRLNAFIRAELQKGRQAYVVYPLIEESERMDFKNLTEGYDFMRDCFPEYKVCMVHGRLKPDEKEKAMHEFVSGEARIMVATTVIEVGVNVPNASVMVIESAERFGLSQLHQLRGRVGRGADQSYCILMTGTNLTRDTRQRMETMCATTNGFEIAEADMTLRGPGDIEGTAQSGMPIRLKIAKLARDGQIVTFARECAQEVLAQDPLLTSPQSVVMTERLKQLSRDMKDWSDIS